MVILSLRIIRVACLVVVVLALAPKWLKFRAGQRNPERLPASVYLRYTYLCEAER